MSVLIQGGQLRTILLGTKVDRATATLPQTATGTLFTVAGGRVLLTSIVGEVTTVIGSTATSANLVHTPTTGTVGDVCAATVITSDEVGTLYGISGDATSLFSADGAGSNAPTSARTGLPAHAVVLPVGNLGLKTTASTTGSVKWSLTYIPLDDGATVTAA
ncbi:hypothetical protein [Streptomyces sp. NRRL F-5123]|uniref:hypothetical protein n=1 Tax=Streptomyces sp. NRRL F-5123 TaxID=1463856 RepID=UPI0004E14E3E|nr:hypothetical protein [Streptomyces sp. NRRL F-5123]